MMQPSAARHVAREVKVWAPIAAPIDLPIDHPILGEGRTLDHSRGDAKPAP